MSDQKLFDLVKIGQELLGYHVDRDLNVWSTKRGAPVKINPKWRPRGRYGRNLHEKLMKCREFIQFLDAPSHTVLDSSLSKDVSEKFYVAIMHADGTPMFSTKPKAHYTEESARQECERLARLNVGVSVAYFRFSGSCICNDFVWS